MIDYIVVGFILLQGVYLYVLEDWGICDVFVVNGKIIVVVSNIFFDIVLDCMVVDFSGQIFFSGFID